MSSSPTSGRWPDRLSFQIAARAGEPVVSTPLRGTSGRDVEAIEGPLGRLVLKASPHPREVQFYRDLVPRLDTGIVAPQCFLADDDWLLLEHVDEPLPRQRWLADTSMMRALASLHRSRSARTCMTDPFLPAWTPELNSGAVALVAREDRAAARRALHRLHGESGQWLSGDVLVSADPDPDNWGVRRDGTLVLFDWERTGLATPAVDVALTVRGLPSRDQLRLSAAAYLDVQERDHIHWSAEDFTFGLAVVKAWACVELLAREDTEPLSPELRSLAIALPAWLAQIP